MLRGRNRRTTTNGDDENRVRPTIPTLKRMLTYVRPYLGWMIVSLIGLVISSLLALVLPMVIGRVVGIVIDNGTLDGLNQLVLTLIGVFVVQAIVSFGQRITLAIVGENAVRDLRLESFEKLHKLPLSYFADNRTGGIVSRLTNDIGLLQDAITENIATLLRQAVILLGAICFLFYLNTRLTVIILVGIPLISLTIVALGRRIRQASKAVQDSLADSANVVEETTSGVRIVKSFARESYELTRYNKMVSQLYEAGMHRARIRAVLAPIIGLLAFLSITMTLWFGGTQVINGTMKVQDLVSYLIYTMMVATPISTLATVYAQFEGAIGATERVFDLLDTPLEIEDKPNAITLPAIQGVVQLQNVDFGYSDSAEILEGIQFTAKQGQVIALVGPSGAGKSTLVNLIPRFYDVSDGAVLIDGYDVRDVTQESLRQQIGIVPQETILFSDTVSANIRYGKLDATDAEIREAAEAANAHNFITQDLLNGYDTLVGERGVKLSGGQRQRVSIARAILKDPRILILDEATSSLDSESERLVQSALERLMQGRTSFVIAHRLSTILNADWILVLDKGKIVEQGTHTNLLTNPDGIYTKLYHLQFRDE